MDCTFFVYTALQQVQQNKSPIDYDYAASYTQWTSDPAHEQLTPNKTP